MQPPNVPSFPDNVSRGAAASREILCAPGGALFRQDSMLIRRALQQLYKHIKERRCIQIITDSTWNKPAKNDSKTNSEVTYKFNHCLNDFPEGNVSVFNRTSTTTLAKLIILKLGIFFIHLR